MPTAISVRKVDGKPGQVYYPLEKISYEEPKPKENEVIVHMTAAALNHRDLFIRQQLYPAIGFGIPLLADGCGIVTSAGSSPQAQKWLKKRVVLNPGSGWDKDTDGPEDKEGYKILGGTKLNPLGTLAESVCIDANELEEAPKHLNGYEAAALPLTGLTAWRATFVKSGNAKPGRNILVTGIGGGVALMALVFASAAGANVYVTSGSEDKIEKAKELGAKGGINYKQNGWEKALVDILPSDRKFLDAIIDGAGGDVVSKGSRILKAGGVISIYGMTTGPKMDFIMPAVLKNIEVRGSTMGSRKEFRDMIEFVNAKQLRPVISKISYGINDLHGIEGLFDEMKKGAQFGKLVIEINKESDASKL